jgi:hypothetical protein
VASVLERAVAGEEFSRPAQNRRTVRLAERALVWFVLLILSGPPRVRPRSLTDALESPLSTLDPTALLHVGAWAGTDALVAYILCSQRRRARAWLRALMGNMSTRMILRQRSATPAGKAATESPYWMAPHSVFKDGYPHPPRQRASKRRRSDAQYWLMNAQTSIVTT